MFSEQVDKTKIVYTRGLRPLLAWLTQKWRGDEEHSCFYLQYILLGNKNVKQYKLGNSGPQIVSIKYTVIQSRNFVSLRSQTL